MALTGHVLLEQKGLADAVLGGGRTGGDQGGVGEAGVGRDAGAEVVVAAGSWPALGLLGARAAGGMVVGDVVQRHFIRCLRCEASGRSHTVRGMLMANGTGAALHHLLQREGAGSASTVSRGFAAR